MRWPLSTTSTDHEPQSDLETSSNGDDWKPWKNPRSVASTFLFTAAIFGSYAFYRSYLRRIPGTAYIKPGHYRKRSLFGIVTRVGDGDNFHLFHTPGGRLAGWGLWRTVPEWKRGDNVTIPVRIAGIDAPENAHFGKEAQPFSAESLTWLRSYLMHQRIRVHIYRKDQYERVVGRVTIRRWLFRRDVGLEMLKTGLCTVYSAKQGAEFGECEDDYRRAEQLARDQKKGIWSLSKKAFESPRAYKIRTASAPENTKQVDIVRPVSAVVSGLANRVIAFFKS